MIRYARTTGDNGFATWLHVFRDGAERDEWLGHDPEPGRDNGWEAGPREAIGGDEAHGGFADPDFPEWDRVTLHAGVRPRGMRRPAGHVGAPGWMGLDSYEEQWNDGAGIDWSRDVDFVLPVH